MKKLEDMTIEELQEQKRTWYEEARRKGSLRACYLIGRKLGARQSAKYGPKYRFDNGLLDIYVDDYGGYMTVHYQDKLVCSTHQTENLFIPGVWFEGICELATKAENMDLEETEARKERERQAWINKLTAPTP